jgi:uncharacterized protein YbbC (DUF1343 family)
MALAEDNLPGVCFRPLRFEPTFQKHAGVVCGGVQLHVIDRESFRSVATGIAILRHVRMLWPDEFAWRTDRYEFRDDVPAGDLLTGQTRVREMIDAGAPTLEIVEFLESTGDEARLLRHEVFIY